MDEELFKYALERVQPDGLDIDVAKQIILNHLTSQDTFEPISSSDLIRAVTLSKQSFQKPISISSGLEPLIEDQLLILRAELAAREAILALHANGVLIAYGGLTAYGGTQVESKGITLQTPHRMGSIGSIALPSVHIFYRLATPFRAVQTDRLSDASIFLSYLNQPQLSSRAKRCLRESIEAFRYGLYLSATMSAGASSESMWMKLASLIYTKRPTVSNEIGKQLNRTTPSIQAIMDATWQVLVSQLGVELKQVFPNGAERKVFKEYADTLCNRRNYAMHSEEADEDEPYFTRNETGRLLLASINYFNQLAKLVATVEA